MHLHSIITCSLLQLPVLYPIPPSSSFCSTSPAALPDDHHPMDASRGSSAIFPMQQIPALLDPPPPPRPLPSSLSLSSSPSSRHAPSITNFPILLLTVFGILTTSVLLLAYYVFVIRCCLNWHSSSGAAGGLVSRSGRRRQRASASSSLPVSGAAPAEPRGLEEAAIQALPAFRYSRKKAGTKNAADSAPASECAVCLGEFEDEERVRMLPACLHVFHVACIDTWLHGNANCPLCRADIASHCLLLPPPVPPLEGSDQHQLRRPQEQEVVIQLVPGAEEADDAAQAQAQAQAQLRGAAAAPAESAGEATAAADHQVVAREMKRKSVSAWHEIDISSKEDDCVAEREDGDVLVLPFSMGTMGDEEVHLQIQKIWQMNTHRSHSDDHDSDSSSSSV